mmetsp:Transcript_10031/g.18980  ORF Transcript_10031/g.18980 Transcript_10031/m.18980 type:complete len:88 (+) Transcript_10031:86-349(+)
MQEAPRRDLRALPKANLHLHMTGSQRRSTFLRRCVKYNMRPPTFPEKGADFSKFREIYDICRKVIPAAAGWASEIVCKARRTFAKTS